MPTGMVVHKHTLTTVETSIYIKDGEPVPEQTIDRHSFESKMDFLFTLIGKVVGPGNLWRFPFLVHKNGGASYILCYTIAAILVGIPVAFLEMAIGQYSGKDCVRVFDFNPIFRGFGFTMCFLSAVMAVYIHVIMAYIIHYFLNSFQSPLPWTVCKKAWKNCFTDFSVLRNMTLCDAAKTPASPPANCTPHPKHAAEYYFYEVVTGHHIENDHKKPKYGFPSWELAVILVGSWFFVTLCTSKGFRYTSKVVYLTVLSPFLGFVIIIIRGLMLEGSSEAIRFMFHSDEFFYLLRVEFWVDVVGQAVIGMTAGLGSNFMFGSYKNFDDKVHVDILIVAFADYLTNILAALSVFLVLGYQAKKSNLRIDSIIKKDEGLVFVAYPSAIATMPRPEVWSSIFFLVLYMLAIDTEFGNIEVVLTYLQDDFCWIRRNNVLARYISGIVGLLLSICLVTPMGLELIQTIDYCVMANVLPFIIFGELVAVFWVYGFNNFIDNMEMMLNLKVRYRAAWRVYCMVCLPIFVGLLPFVRNIKEKGEIDHEDWYWTVSHTIFYMHIVPVILWVLIDVWAVTKRYWRHGRKTMYRKLFRPNHRWRPNDGSNVYRDVDSVFADVIPSMRRRKPRRECHSASEIPFAHVHKSFLCLPEFVINEGEEDGTGEARGLSYTGVLEAISLVEKRRAEETKPEEARETKPGEGHESKPGEGHETKPGEGHETKPEEVLEIKPEEVRETNVDNSTALH